MKFWCNTALASVSFAASVCASVAFAQQDRVASPTEAYRDVQLPPGVRVEVNELEGPVFVDIQGKTLYTWRQNKHRNGYSADTPGRSTCLDEVITETAGLMSPYPPGMILPDADTRPACTDMWPPFLAAEDADPETEIGDWTLIARPNGDLQWAYKELPVYTSALDEQTADVYGGNSFSGGGDAPAYRRPIRPPAVLPPGFEVRGTHIGRMLGTEDSGSVYSYEGDTATSTNCYDECLKNWDPVIAPTLARAQGEWSIFERAPGIRQWVFRGKPLYTYKFDSRSGGQVGTDEPGWSNVFTQRAPAYPLSFTVQATLQGEVLATPEGKTIYRYNCAEDTMDQLLCDHPKSTQVYRIAMCGGGNPERCLSYWPYVVAADDEESLNRTWRVLTIDPLTGRLAEPGSEGSLRVWAYRNRPVYTFGRDEKPGDVKGGGTGEWRGRRNGLKAFWLRDDYMGGISK